MSIKLQRIFQHYYNVQSHTKVLGIAKNYGVADPDWEPIWFDKPMSSVIFNDQTLELPKHFTKIVHEVELGILIGMPARNIR